MSAQECADLLICIFKFCFFKFSVAATFNRHEFVGDTCHGERMMQSHRIFVGDNGIRISVNTDDRG